MAENSAACWRKWGITVRLVTNFIPKAGVSQEALCDKLKYKCWWTAEVFDRVAFDNPDAHLALETIRLNCSDGRKPDGDGDLWLKFEDLEEWWQSLTLDQRRTHKSQYELLKHNANLHAKV